MDYMDDLDIFRTSLIEVMESMSYKMEVLTEEIAILKGEQHLNRCMNKEENDASDKPEEEEKPVPTGPFRYESKSEEASAWAEEFENKKSAKTQKPTTSPLAIRTFRNKECIVQGQNRFDDVVSNFLGTIGRDNVIHVSPINYTDPQDKSPDYGVVVYYENSSENNAEPKQAEDTPAAEPVVWRD